MVLNKSKWDKKAKIKYLKKHGLLKTNESQSAKTPNRKWSSKKAEPTKSLHSNIVLEDSDSEDWDSEEDDAFINDFYPQLGEDKLTKDQKRKIKNQILIDLAQRQQSVNESVNEQSDTEVSHEEIDGIYLGSKENREKDIINSELEQINIQDLIAKDNSKSIKNRKILKARVSDNLLEEYGIDDYTNTIKSEGNDYNSLYNKKKQERNIDQIRPHELNGFRIGDSNLTSPSDKSKKGFDHIRKFTDTEVQENKERAAKIHQHNLYNQIRKKFDKDSSKSSKSRVIEINNFNDNDLEQMERLNTRLLANHNEPQKITDKDIESDIDLLLGDNFKGNLHNEEPDNSQVTDIDDLFNQISLGNQSQADKKNICHDFKQGDGPSSTDQDFLDDLLG